MNGGKNNGPGQPEIASCQCDFEGNPHVGSVVEVASAAWREMWTDLTLPGIGLPLVFGRTYASRSDSATTLGPRWTHTFATRLTEELNGDLTWTMDDLRTARYVRTSP